MNCKKNLSFFNGYTSVCPKYSSIYKNLGLKNPPICITLFVQPHIMLKKEEEKPKQFLNNYSDVLQMPFKLAENINFVSTQDRKAHLYSTCNYSTHNIIAVITKYGT